MSELLPCPFCGCPDIDEYEGDYGNGVYCMNCGAMMGEPIHLEFRVDKRVTYDEAIAAWNTRAPYEADGYFFLPKPKESLYSVSEPTYFVDGHNVKATCGVSIMEDSVKRWQRQIEESTSRDVVGRICEVFGNTRAERTCHDVHEPPRNTTFWPAPHFKCSECGKEHVSTDYVFYCPNCGAKVMQDE